jgi:hypothetical protein
VHSGGSRDAARRLLAARSLAAARRERWAAVISRRLAAAWRKQWGTVVSKWLAAGRRERMAIRFLPPMETPMETTICARGR